MSQESTNGDLNSWLDSVSSVDKLDPDYIKQTMTDNHNLAIQSKFRVHLDISLVEKTRQLLNLWNYCRNTKDVELNKSDITLRNQKIFEVNFRYGITYKDILAISPKECLKLVHNYHGPNEKGISKTHTYPFNYYKAQCLLSLTFLLESIDNNMVENAEYWRLVCFPNWRLYGKVLLTDYIQSMQQYCYRTPTYYKAKQVLKLYEEWTIANVSQLV